MSFAQEIKDFLGAATSTYKMLDDAEYGKIKRGLMRAQTDKLNADLNDPTIKAQREANLAATRANTAATERSTNDPNRDAKAKAEIAATNARTGYYNQRQQLIDDHRKALANPPEDPIAAGISAPPARAVTPPKPAIGPMSALEEDEELGAIPTAFGNKGGLIQKFADGGMVEDEDLEDDDELVTPEVTPAVGGTPTDVSAQSRSRISQDAGHDAVVAGLKYGVNQLGGAGIPTAGRQQRMQAFMRGAGAAPIADMNAIYKKIDPNNEMGDSERSLNAMSAVYQYKLRQGDMQGAQRAAFGMLQHYRLASQRYAAIAAAAAEQGDVDGAAKAAMKAYANIPDGKGLKVAKSADGQLTYSVIDEKTGKVTQQGIASPQQLAAAAMGVATKDFDKFLISAAGERAAGGKGAVGGGAKPPREGDKGKALEGIDAAYEKTFPAKDEERTLKGNAYRVYTSNPGLTHAEALDVTKRLISPNAKNPEDAGFKAKQLEEGQGYLVKVGKGAPVRISEEDFDAMASIRAEKAEALKKTKAGESKGGFLKEAAGAIGDYASKIPGAVSDDLEKAGQTEFGARVKSAVGSAGRAIGDAYDWAKKDLAKSSTLRGMMNGPGEDKF